MLKQGELAAALGAGATQLVGRGARASRRRPRGGGRGSRGRPRSRPARRRPATCAPGGAAESVTAAPPPRLSSISSPPPSRAMRPRGERQAAADPADQLPVLRRRAGEPGRERPRGVGDAGAVVGHADEGAAVEDAHGRVAEAGVHEVLDDLAHGRRRQGRAVGDGVAERARPGPPRRRRPAPRRRAAPRALRTMPGGRATAGPGTGAGGGHGGCEGEGRGHRGRGRGGHSNPAPNGATPPSRGCGEQTHD